MAIKQAVINFVANTQAAKRQIQDFKSNFKAATKEMGDTFIGKFGAIGAAFGGFQAVKDVFNQTQKLSNFSKTFSVPVEEVSKFSNVLSMFGGSSDEAIGDLQKIQQAIVDFKTTGGGALKTVAAQVGLSLQNTDGSIKNSIQVIESLRQKFKGLSESAQLKVSQELGLADPATLQMLRASDEEYKKITEDASKMNVVNQTTADRVQKMTRILATLKNQWYGIGVQVMELVLPAVKYVTQAMEWFNRQGEGTKNIIVGITAALVAIKPAADVFKFMSGGVKALIAPLKLVFGLMATNPILATISLIVLGIAYFDEITAALDNFLSRGTPFSKFCKGVVENLKLIMKPLSWVSEGIGWLAAKFSGGGKAELTEEQKAARKAFMETGALPEVMPTTAQNQAAREANTFNNSTTTTTNTKSVVNNQTFNFNGIGEDVTTELQNVIRQNTSGVGA